MRTTELGFERVPNEPLGQCARCGGMVAYTDFICCDNCWKLVHGVSRITGIHRNMDGGDTRRLVNPGKGKLPFSVFKDRVEKRVFEINTSLQEEEYCIYHAQDDARLDMNMVDVAAYAFIIAVQEDEKLQKSDK